MRPGPPAFYPSNTPFVHRAACRIVSHCVKLLRAVGVAKRLLAMRVELCESGWGLSLSGRQTWETGRGGETGRSDTDT
jgi:hypothetical protein